jgi:hypothetical protein
LNITILEALLSAVILVVIIIPSVLLAGLVCLRRRRTRIPAATFSVETLLGNGRFIVAAIIGALFPMGLSLASRYGYMHDWMRIRDSLPFLWVLVGGLIVAFDVVLMRSGKGPKEQ